MCESNGCESLLNLLFNKNTPAVNVDTHKWALVFFKDAGDNQCKYGFITPNTLFYLTLNFAVTEQVLYSCAIYAMYQLSLNVLVCVFGACVDRQT